MTAVQMDARSVKRGKAAAASERVEASVSGSFQITQQTVPSGLRLIPAWVLELLHIARSTARQA